MSAAKSGDHTKVEKMLEDGADVDTKEIDSVSIRLFSMQLLCNMNSFDGLQWCGLVTKAILKQ